MCGNYIEYGRSFFGKVSLNKLYGLLRSNHKQKVIFRVTGSGFSMEITRKEFGHVVSAAFSIIPIAVLKHVICYYVTEAVCLALDKKP